MAAEKKQPQKKQANQTGSQSGDYRAQQLHQESGGIGDPRSRDKSAHGKQQRMESGRMNTDKKR